MLKRSLLSKAVDPQRRWGNLIFFLMSGKLLKTWATVCPCSGSSMVMLYMRSRSRLDNPHPHPPNPQSHINDIFSGRILWNDVVYRLICGIQCWVTFVSLKFQRSLFLIEIKMSYLTYNPQHTHTHVPSVWREFTIKTKIIRNIFKGIRYNGCEKYIKRKESGN